MMAEETGEELSMEDILSSIKDILAEDIDGQKQNRPDTAASSSGLPNADSVSDENSGPVHQEDTPVFAPQVSVPSENESRADSARQDAGNAPLSTADVIAPDTASSANDEAPEDPLDDVLTLSPAMIVETDNTPAAASSDAAAGMAPEAPAKKEDKQGGEEVLPAEEINIDRELAGISMELADGEDLSLPELDDVSLPELDDSVNGVITENFEEKGLNAADNREMTVPDLDFDLPKVDLDADPIYSPEEDDKPHSAAAEIMEESIIDDATLNAILDGQPEDPAREENFDDPTDNSYENAVIEEQREMPAVPHDEAAADADREKVAEAEPAAVGAVPDGKLPEASDDEAVDLSASIISNFAKMFSEAKKEEDSSPAGRTVNEVMDKIDLGNGGLTVEALIRDVVAELVMKNLESGFSFEKTATEEISRQTKIWLNRNLPAVVEALVRKEIERVMAKVSS